MPVARVRGTVLLTAAIAFFGAARAASAGPGGDPAHGIDLPVEGVVTNPDWISRPTGDQLSAVYPVVAQALNISGRAEVNCAVTVQGDVDACTVANEFPLGQGFGQAALALTPYFKMKPQMVDGQPVGGARVNIPIHFVLAEELPAPAAPEPSVATPTPEALDLARRIVAASGHAPAVPAELAGWMSGMQRLAQARPADTESARAQRAALDAFMASLEQARPQFEDARAHAIAETYTEAELRQIAAFLDTPTGQAWASRQTTVDALETRETVVLIGAAREAARVRYCETGHCPGGLTPTPKPK